MNRKQIWTMVLRWSIITTVPIALYWFIFLLAKGHIPVATVPGVVSYIPLRVEPGMHDIPRWLDIIFVGPLWSTFVIWWYWKGKVKIIYEQESIKSTNKEVFIWLTWLVSLCAFPVAFGSGIVSGLSFLASMMIVLAFLFLFIPAISKIYKWAMLSEEKPKEESEKVQ